MVDLLDTIQSSLGPVFEDRASALMDRPPELVRRAVEIGVPALLVGMADLARTPDGSRRFAELVRGPKVDPEFVERASLVVDAEMTRQLLGRGGDLAGALFGARRAGIVHAIADIVKLGNAEASLLLSLLTPFALTAVKRVAVRGRLNARGLSRLLDGQTVARNDLDPRLAEAISTERPVYLEPSHARPRPAPRRPSGISEGPARPARTPLLAAAAVVAVAAVGGWVLVSDGDGEVEPVVAETAAEVADVPMTRSGIADLNGALRRIALPDGRAFEAPAGGLADQLASHLRMGGLGEARFPTETDIRFDPGTSRIEPSAGPVLDDVAGVLRAYPDALVRVEAALAPDGLDRRRADAIRNALIERGVAERRFEVQATPTDLSTGVVEIVIRG